MSSNPMQTMNNPFHHRRKSSGGSDDLNPFDTPEIYYGPKTNPALAKKGSKFGRTRTLSIAFGGLRSLTALDSDSEDETGPPRASTSNLVRRRASQDDTSGLTKRFFISDIDSTLNKLLESEDTDRNMQITIEDTGPKVLKLGTANSNGFNSAELRGTYMLSNLLQELTIAKRMGRNQMILDEARLNENPVDRLSRLISTQFWRALTRRLDDTNIAVMAADTKIKTPGSVNPRIYIPHDCPEQYEYFVNASLNDPDAKLEVEYLPKEITPKYVRSINDRPGLLALAMEKTHDPATGELTLRPFPYVVPGGRFNELYGWDSYMETLGLLIDNKVELARGMAENHIFEIFHYGKVLNANRSYYLCRSQPPFLTDMAFKIYEKLGGDSNPDATDFLKRAIQAAIKDYNETWCNKPRLDERTGLSCYHPDGLGIPPETESTHFDSVLKPFCAKYGGISIKEFFIKYNNDEIDEPELDEYFLHDRAVRESGHDTSYRLEGKCANLATVDLNSLLYKYEVDISRIISEVFNNGFQNLQGEQETASKWKKLAELRKARINEYLWNEEEGIYFDYDIKLQQQSTYESATTFWTLWAGLSSQAQAESLVNRGISRFECLGGLAAGTEKSRGEVGLDRPSRQWDYPFGWAPQQMLAWIGLKNYGYEGVARRLAYRWLFLMTKAFVDYNGIVVEKYDVTRGSDPHKVDAEYGNQGADFKGVATEGFGWVNASYILGLTFTNQHARRALGACTPPETFFKNLRTEERGVYSLG